MAVLFCWIATSLLSAGSTVEAAADPRALQLTYDPWTKYCFKHGDGSSDCLVGTGVRGACLPSGGSFSLTRGDKSESLSVNVGTKQALEGAISVQIDQDPPILISHTECHGLYCGGKLEIDNGFTERLKRSRTVAIEPTTTVGQKISLSLSLADFAAAYDGPESDPPKVHEDILSSEKSKEEMQRAEEQRKALECKE